MCINDVLADCHTLLFIALWGLAGPAQCPGIHKVHRAAVSTDSPAPLLESAFARSVAVMGSVTTAIAIAKSSWG